MAAFVEEKKKTTQAKSLKNTLHVPYAEITVSSVCRVMILKSFSCEGSMADEIYPAAHRQCARNASSLGASDGTLHIP